MTALAIRLDAIVLDDTIQCRATINTGVVNEYAMEMTEGATFPPVTLFEDGGKHYIGDGWHRVMACKQIGALDIVATVEPGGRAAALKHALSANAIHGHRRTNADKRRCVEIALREFANLSSRAIAELCGVSPDFTARMRGEQVSSDDTSTVTGADGKKYRAKQPAKRKPKPNAAFAKPAKANVPPPSPSTPPDLETIVAGLEAEGKKNMATMSPGTVAILAWQLRRRLAMERDRVDAEITKRVEAAVAQERARQQRVDLVWSAFRTVDEWMTKDEFRLVLQCLHPDHAPEDRRDKYTRAFAIFNRLQDRTSKNKRDLARNGWATKPAEKPRKPPQKPAGDAQATAAGAA